MEFIEIWDLLVPQGEYKRREAACARLWQGYSPEMQHRIYDAISKAKANGGFVNQNPYFAIEDTAIRLQRQQARRQEMSFAEYYAKYGTTAETDGWKMTNPTGQQVIYIKN